MNTLSKEQREVVEETGVLSVTACAGSGKTETSIHRLAEIRQRMGESRGRPALLSFSNVAVDTFRKGYLRLLGSSPTPKKVSTRVEIDTMDGFFTANVLRPHGHHSMSASRHPFLVKGNESFLARWQIWMEGKNGRRFPRPIGDLRVAADGGGFRFFVSDGERETDIDRHEGARRAAELGTMGAYTHDLGRYWCMKVLSEHEWIRRTLARRYPVLMIDEAQDIGDMHGAILELLIREGVRVEVVGDPNQAIYEFARATGDFLRGYVTRSGVAHHSLLRNYRSIAPIVQVANNLSGTAATAHRTSSKEGYGTYFFPYAAGEEGDLIERFQNSLVAAGLSVEQSAVVCRARATADTLRGASKSRGQGVVQTLATAAIKRDADANYAAAFELVTSAILSLMQDVPPDMYRGIVDGAGAEAQDIRRILWAFTRHSATGLPASTLCADSQWHRALVGRVKTLVKALEQATALKAGNNIGQKLSKRDLPNGPLLMPTSSGPSTIRIDTVHQVKGESLDALLYIASKDHIKKMLNGTSTELGRIGYVAVTRPRFLLWVGVPASCIAEMRPGLRTAGFTELAAAATTVSLRTSVC